MLLQSLIAFFKKLTGRSPVVPLFGVAWYNEDQWTLLQKVSSDTAQLEPTYDLWLKNAQARYDQLTAEGKRLQKVVVDVADMADWCREMGREVDSAGRTAYVVYRLHEQKMAPKLKLLDGGSRPRRTRF